MSASSKFDLSSSSPDRLLYTSGQRGSYAAASFDRSGSFRENVESPTLPALPNMTRGSSAATQGDVASFLQCLRFDPKLMVSNHKLNRPVDFKRLASLSLGVPVEDSSSIPPKGKPLSTSSPEDFRRLKVALRESCSKARERVKIFNESLSGMNKLFPAIPSRKRSRSDALSNDRSILLYSADRSVSGTGLSKMGAQNQVSTNGFEVEQKSEERTKSAPNKRTRTSMVDPRMDARANNPARPSGVTDRDREISKVPNNSAVQSEDRTLPIGDGWEKSKMKKKRSGIKSDVAASSAAAKPIDGSRDSKLGMQQRLHTDPRSRLTDTHGFRPGVANGGVAKVDSASQQTGSGVRSSIYRAEQDNGSLLQDRRDRPIEKERVNLKAINKANAREDFSAGSPTSSTKINASTRAPQSGSTVGPKLSPVMLRPASANDWELSQCTSKLPAAVGIKSRKRTPSMRSSSPPVAQWASHRPQKISRTARRTSFIPIVQNNDESSALDTTSFVGSERRLSGSSPQQVKLKNDFSSTALSESEESGAAEMKFKEKTKKSDDVDEKAGKNVLKLSNLMLPPRKNKVINGEDHGDGIRRQGRTGRGFTSTRSLMPLSVEKPGNVGTSKQLRSTRLGFDKTESKTGRPPSRKLSDRKSYTRQKHTMVNVAADFLVGSDDGHEELLAAANAVINPAQALSSSFWKQMEPVFSFISDIDMAFLNQQLNLEPLTSSSAPVPSGIESTSFGANGFGFNELGREGIKTKHAEHYQEHLASGIGGLDDVSLYQRLIAAIIPEGDEELCFSGNEGLTFDVYECGFELEKDIKSDCLQSQILHNSDVLGRPASNGYRINANGRSFGELEHIMADDNIISSPDVIPSYDSSQNGLLPDQALTSGSTCTEFQYNNMSINERLLLEIHCIGIYPEVSPDSAHVGNGEIAGEISRLNEKYHDQVSKRKGLLNRLLKSAAETRELQEREFEQNALDKLVAMAYEKYMTCWGPNAHGMKSSSGKMAKQAALALVKRTLERCQEFKDTGKSCFSEPLFRDMFLSGVSRLSDGRTTNPIPDGEFGKLHGNTSSGLNEVRASATLGAQQSPSLNNQEIYSSETLLSGNLASEQTTCKEETWSSRVKKKELLLDDVGGGAMGISSGVASGIGSSFISSAKGKRSERDREGKGSSREVLSRGGTTKTGRPMSANVKGERKSKTKPKQKTTQLSASVNGLLGKMSEKPSVPKSSDTSSSGVAKDKNDYSLDELEDPIDLSGLQLPEMDVLGVPDDLGGQGQDIGSWLNIDDDGLQDHDFMGLEIPMDDLADLNMMV